MASFYVPFIQGLYDKLGGLVDVFCISQLGHNPQCSMHSQQVVSCLLYTACMAHASADTLHASMSKKERFIVPHEGLEETR